jgi:Minichromosome loss protein, Mcl1, middle region
MRFELEEVKAVALGKNWVAAVTCSNFLRIFTEGGLQVLPFFCANYIEMLTVFVAVNDFFNIRNKEQNYLNKSKY